MGRTEENPKPNGSADEKVPDTSLTRVPERATRGGEMAGPLQKRWSWVDFAVWTPRMVHALDNGVKGGVWYTLWDKIITPEALASAFTRVKVRQGAAGVDRVSVRAYARDLERNLRSLHASLRDGTYRPSAIRRCHIPKVGSKELRPLGIPTVQDRIVQAALRAGLEPIFEREFGEHSYGFRPGRTAHQALDRVEHLLCAGYVWVVEVDLKSYFDTVPHAPLMALVKKRVVDGKVLGLVETFLTQPIVEGDRRWTPSVGTPQGAVISPLLANIYLHPLDLLMAQRGQEMTRYADDFVIQCRTEEDAQRALAAVSEWCGSAALTLHPTKTRVLRVSETEGFDFLGYHFRQRWGDPTRTVKWVREKSAAKLREAIRPLTRRTSGVALTTIVQAVNARLRGFFNYFYKSATPPLRELDKWVRMRLRSILRRRERKRGCGRGLDHFRWPNAFFENQGLFSLARA